MLISTAPPSRRPHPFPARIVHTDRIGTGPKSGTHGTTVRPGLPGHPVAVLADGQPLDVHDGRATARTRRRPGPRVADRGSHRESPHYFDDIKHWGTSNVETGARSGRRHVHLSTVRNRITIRGTGGGIRLQLRPARDRETACHYEHANSRRRRVTPYDTCELNETVWPVYWRIRGIQLLRDT